MLHM